MNEGVAAEKAWLRYAAQNTYNGALAVENIVLTGFEPYRAAVTSLADEGLEEATADMLWDSLSPAQRQEQAELGFDLAWLQAHLAEPLKDVEWRHAEKTLAQRRKRQVLTEASDRIYEMLSAGADVDAVVKFMLEAADAAQGISENALLTGREAAEATAQIVHEYYSGGGQWRTGITELDHALSGGLSPQQLLVIGAQPGHGKSLLAHAIAEGIARHNGTRAFFFDCEMGERTTLLRQLERIHGAKPLGMPNEDMAVEWLTPSLKAVADSPMVIGTPRNVSLQTALRQSLMAVNAGCRVIVWDGATLLGSPGKGSIREELLEVTRQAKAFARRHDVVLILTGQLNQDRLPSSGQLVRPPDRRDFKESRSFTEDADYVLLVRRVDRWQCIGDTELYGVENPENLKRRVGLTWVRLAKDRHEGKEDQIVSLNLTTPGLRYAEENLPPPLVA